MTVFIHPKAICESATVGDRTRIWAFAHVLPGAVIGEDCNICDGVFVENDVHIGDRVTIKCGVQIWDGVTLEDDVFVGPNATFTNDRFPRSRVYPQSFARTTVCRGASLGANCTILPGLRIGRGAMVGAGAVVTRDVPANAIVVGSPARISGYVDQQRGAIRPSDDSSSMSPASLGVGAASLIHLRRADDMRGSLVSVELDTDLPFRPRRAFTVFGVPTKDVRGEHAHRQCHQALVCTSGSVTCIVDDGLSRVEVVLSDPSMCLYMPPMLWGTQYRYEPDTVLTVFASHPYDPLDYIRTYEDFLAESGAQG